MKVLTQTDTWGQSREDKTVEILKKKFGKDNVNAIGKLGSKADMIGGVDCEVIINGRKLSSQIKPFGSIEATGEEITVIGSGAVKKYYTDWLIFTRNNKDVLIFRNKNSKIVNGQYVFPKGDLIYSLN
jgi:hypothetical protein